MAIKIKIGDIVTDDLTRTKAKVIEIIPRALPHYLPMYRIDSEYLDGLREAWEIWTDEQLKELEEEELNKGASVKISKTARNFNLDGSEATDPLKGSAIILIMEEDKNPNYEQGWYYTDEAEQIHGPYNTFEEAVKEFNNYYERFERGE